MSTASLFAYALALLLAIATPGPAMIAVISRGIAQGSRPALLMAVGVAVADVILGALALFGLAALMTMFSWLSIVVKYAGAAYLIWLGIRMWRAPPAASNETAATGRRDLLLGMTIALSNPRAILFHASLMPLIIDLRLLSWWSAGAILAIILLANLLVMSGYALVAGAGGRRFRSSVHLKWMSWLAGGSMIGAGSLIAAR
jgi:threonine/homoserine/homoserine lactone efflux protein